MPNRARECDLRWVQRWRRRMLARYEHVRPSLAPCRQLESLPSSWRRLMCDLDQGEGGEKYNWIDTCTGYCLRYFMLQNVISNSRGRFAHTYQVVGTTAHCSRRFEASHYRHFVWIWRHDNCYRSPSLLSHSLESHECRHWKQPKHFLQPFI